MWTLILFVSAIIFVNADRPPPHCPVCPSKPGSSGGSSKAVATAHSSSSSSSSSSSYSSSSATATVCKDHNRCDRNSTYKKCPNPCPPSCVNPNGVKNCYRLCEEYGCECKKGYVKSDNGKCILLKDCPDYLRCHGDRNATFKECPNPCPPTCQYPSGTGICSRMCLKEGCECKEGYYLSEDGVCVQLQDCPGARNCSANETFVYCNINCPTNYCPVDDNSGTIICDPVFPCESGCSCKEGYLRLNDQDNRCILASECPPVTCTKPNEEWDRCPPPCPNNRCSDLVDPRMCALAFDWCRPQCVCKKGFYKNDSNICVPENECPPQCGYNEVLVECKTFCPPQNCDISYTEYDCTTVKFACVPGCDCLPNYLRNASGVCIPNEECPPPPVCGYNEMPVNCKTVCPPQVCDPYADSWCDTAGVSICQPGCDCLPNYLRNASGICIPSEECPPSLQCGYNEMPVKCKTVCPPQVCENSYTEYACDPNQTCEPGCDCLPNYLRNSSGICIPNEECIPPITCPINEEPSSCRIICPPQTCESIYTEYLCIADIPCEWGCNCVSGYLRNSSGVCIPSDQCPTNPPLICGYNEVPSPCKITCPPQTCDSIFSTYICENNDVCEPGCNCIDKYLRNASGICVPSEDCFLDTCDIPSECRPTCANPKPQNCPSVDQATSNQDGCKCKPGYILTEADGICIRIAECPAGCNGDPNAIATSCPWPCPSTCNSPNAGLCGKKCEPVGCQCQPGFILNKKNGKCIKPDKCKFGNPCGQNGTFSECAFRCPNQNCPQDDSGTVIACKPGRPCPSGCLCKEYYRRDSNDNCILASDCPPVKCTKPNEVWDPCASECLAEDCSNKNQNIECYPDPNNCQPKCVCCEGYLRNKTGNCIPKDECQPPCPINSDCLPTCAVPNPPGCPFIPPFKTNEDGCRCKEGYILAEVDGKCIKIEECPTNIGCNGDPHARVKQCPQPCPSTCKSPNAIPCKRKCDPIGCECEPGYILSDINGKCILPDDCNGGNPCGPNGTFVQCKYNCPTSYCPTSDSRALPICETYPFVPCLSGCVCQLNHRLLSREDPRCIRSDECPPVDCTRPCEIWDPCPIECGSGYCEEVDRPPVVCNTLVLNCNPQCVCKKGSFRNPHNDYCVTPRECRMINKKIRGNT